ncbi:methionyl-tRNA formyltransferase [Homoserinimonas sp. OAct 916]|uniref:methionyl-tRNA formyltransferase n=1 Tax=Homoserinimonas sp. OAct 916 TaxID=2211450 RepID=UPI000DBE4A11|nr:methionyl-tRNA formyltransferase [Homoserinimonas sp. OAct 916]
MRLIFAGTPEAAVPSLRRLFASAHDIVGVLTREDAPLGRKRVLTPSPVARAAEALGLPVLKANRIDDAMTSELAALDADLGVIVAFGALLRRPTLDVPRLGWVNLHFSLLPAWRGAAPVQRAIMAGDTVSGGTVFQLVEQLDAGDILATFEHHLNPDATAGETLGELAVSGAELLAATVDRLAGGRVTPRVQEGPTSYAHKLGPDDGLIDWNDEAAAVYNRIRGVTPEPGAYWILDGERVKVHAARLAGATSPVLLPGEILAHDGQMLIGTGSTALELVTVQPAGKKAMPAADWWRGRPASVRSSS